MPPFAADDLIRQARRYKSRRELTRAIKLIARADVELRSSPPDKRLVLERLVYELASSQSRFRRCLQPPSFPSRSSSALAHSARGRTPGHRRVRERRATRS